MWHSSLLVWQLGLGVRRLICVCVHCLVWCSSVYLIKTQLDNRTILFSLDFTQPIFEVFTTEHL